MKYYFPWTRDYKKKKFSIVHNESLEVYVCHEQTLYTNNLLKNYLQYFVTFHSALRLKTIFLFLNVNYK